MPDWADEGYWAAVRTKANADGEFSRHAKFWNATIRLGTGRRKRPAAHRRRRGGRDRAGQRRHGASISRSRRRTPTGDALLAALPPPFYQDLYPASLHHGFDVVGSLADYCAYYPAIRRLIEIMREAHVGEVRHDTPSRPNDAPQFDAAHRPLRASAARRGDPPRLFRGSRFGRCRPAPAAHRRRGRQAVAPSSRRRGAALEVPPGRLRPPVPRQVRAADGCALVAGGVPADPRLSDVGADGLG